MPPSHNCWPFFSKNYMLILLYSGQVTWDDLQAGVTKLLFVKVLIGGQNDNSSILNFTRFVYLSTSYFQIIVLFYTHNMNRYGLRLFLSWWRYRLYCWSSTYLHSLWRSLLFLLRSSIVLHMWPSIDPPVFNKPNACSLSWVNPAALHYFWTWTLLEWGPNQHCIHVDWRERSIGWWKLQSIRSTKQLASKTSFTKLMLYKFIRRYTTYWKGEWPPLQRKNCEAPHR